MGGDFAPREIVAGAVAAALEYSNIGKLYLVGDESAVKAELDSHGKVSDKIEIVHASQVVEMGDAPSMAVRRKKDSSISRAVDLVKAGDAGGVYSAGNTGAAVAATKLKLRTLQGIERAGIATVLPSHAGHFVMMDAGANIDCSVRQLYEFAVMGSVYSREILGVKNPTVGLLSIGGEDAKGNATTKEAFAMLERANLNFIGNVEPKDLFSGRVDVVSVDGFVGNVVLKTSEAVAKSFGRWLKEELLRNPVRKLGALISRNAFRDLMYRTSPDTYGGAPLLGVNGACIIGHGSSSARAAKNAIHVAAEWVTHDINHLIIDEVAKDLEEV